MIHPNRGARPSGRILASAALLVALVLLGLLSAISSAEPAQTKKANRYIGAQKCKTCHSAKDTGNQFEALSHMKHSHAFEVLATDAAKKTAKEKGIDDPQKADACVKCHVTAFGVAEADLAKGFDRTIGIQCETCHGPGEAHMKARMAAAATEDPDAPKVYKGVPEGEVVTHPAMAVCTGCHNTDSPNYKPFCHCKSKLEIRHLNPKRERTDAEKALLTACECKAECACKQACCKDGPCTELAKPAK
ncbi:MAG: cytochrome c family protein [Planctomycetes bacterium]|nr:cytochrome c family protein [Planctomycetota bacterium]